MELIITAHSNFPSFQLNIKDVLEDKEITKYIYQKGGGETDTATLTKNQVIFAK